LPVSIRGAIVVRVKYMLKHKLSRLLILPAGILFIFFFSAAPIASAAPAPATGCPTGTYCCGDAADGGKMQTAIDLGCKGKGNAIFDLTFAIIRLLSDGVGIVVVASVVVAGIQYTASRNDPQNVANATNRIRSSLIALLIFIFAYAILDYVIPVKFFSQ